jgi:hypothetical protein
LSFLWYNVALTKKKIDSELICAGKKLSKFVKTKDSMRGEEMAKRFEMIYTKLGSNLTNKHLFLSFQQPSQHQSVYPYKKPFTL